MARKLEFRNVPRKPEKSVCEEKGGQRCQLPRRPRKVKTSVPTDLAAGGLWRGRWPGDAEAGLEGLGRGGQVRK